MKKLLCWLGLLMLLAGAAWAASVTLAWDASPGPDIAWYRVYYGPDSRVYTNLVQVGGNVYTATVSNLVPDSMYYFAATAGDTNNLESDFSNEVSYRVPVYLPRPPGALWAGP